MQEVAAREMVSLNADVVGYSALIADDVETTTATMTRFHRLVADKVEESNGTLANFVGDSFMAVFDDAMSALRAALAIAAGVESHNEDVPPTRRVRFRMGMDQGPVTFAAGNHHGDALNIAARIQAIARPGGLAVSGRVYRSLDEPALRFRAMGPQRLKNIPEQIDVYEFVDLPSDATHVGATKSLALESPTLAVLPIHSEMVDDAVKAAGRMIRSDLLHRLASLPDLRVVDAPSEPAGGTGRKGASYMLETGVHQFGPQVRVFATLFDVNTMNVVKSLKWSAPVDGLFELSDRVADEVARAVEVDLVVGTPARLYAELDDPDAIEKVYLGWYHVRSDTPESWQRAVDLFGEVADARPDLPYGWVLSAYTFWLGAVSGFTPPEPALDRAVELAEHGAEIGDRTGMAQAVLAAVFMTRGDVDGALEMLDRLEDLRPTCDMTYGLEGSVRRYLGEWERSVELMDQAMRLTGINKPWYPTVKASSLFVGGRLEEAAALAEGVLEHQPNNLEALLVLAGVQVELGLERRARATAELIKTRFPAVDVEGWLDKTPYQRREIVDRWKGDLASVGAIEA